METGILAILFWFSASSLRCQTSTTNAHGGYDAVLGVSNASVLLLDPLSETLYLGARDTVLALHPHSLSHTHPAIIWEAAEKQRAECVRKGKSEDECRNYICLLGTLTNGNIYVCGSYAYDPHCAYIDPVTFTLVREGEEVKTERKKGSCPYEPGKPHTSVTADGVLYSATSTNFLGTRFDVARVTGRKEEQVRIESTWLSDPEFVSSAVVRAEPEQEDQLYWFLTESVKEHDLYTTVKVTRVIRVCKGDVGGLNTLQGRWTTFLKAELLCKEARPGGRRYTVLKHLQPLEHRPGDPASTHFYGLFTSQWGGELVSAVCVYSVGDVATVMASSKFKDMKTCGNTAVTTDVPSPRPAQCMSRALREQGYNSSLQTPDRVLVFAKEHPQLVSPVQAAPLLVRRGVTHTRLAAAWAGLPSTDALVLYLGTDQGELHSVCVVGGSATLLQEIPVTTSVEPINNILIHQRVVLVGSASGLVQVPGLSCGVWSSCEGCVRASGLGCVWDATEGCCTSTHTPGSPGRGRSHDLLKVCGTEEALCSPVVKELRVMSGVRLLLPCSSPSLSPARPPCAWTHPPARHTRLLPSAQLELRASPSSQGLYSCVCPGHGAPSRGAPGCLTASYRLTLEEEEEEEATPPVGVPLACVLAGALLGALLTFGVTRGWGSRARSPLLADGNGRGSETTPASRENEGGGTGHSQSGAGILRGTGRGQSEAGIP